MQSFGNATQDLANCLLPSDSETMGIEYLSKHISRRKKVYHINFSKNNENSSNMQQENSLTFIHKGKEIILMIKQRVQTINV